MKKLPIGMQSIEEIIEGGYVYVDKTALIFQLITQGKYYFISRPRRFGKSLLVSTLKAILSGNKKLFKNCQIHSTDYDWHEHPVIYLDFTLFSTESTEELEEDLKKSLIATAKSYGKSIDSPTSARAGLISLVKALSTKNKVVVLVDEYDKPVIDNLDQKKLFQANRKLLRNFFASLKGLDRYLKLIFVTGVSKFSQVSLFSGFNNLNDITIDPEYATLMGYTQTEMHQFFSDRLKKLILKRSEEGNPASEKEILEEMKEWYNGYRFSWGQPAVYNPYSTLNFLNTGRVQSYWFRTGTPSFLIKQIKKIPQSIVPLSGVLATEDELLNIRSPRVTSFKTLMWQTGYLTIQGYNPKNCLYQLDFPNKEVRQAFFGSLIQEFAGLESSAVTLVSSECKRHLEKQNLSDFFNMINVFFAKIPYSLFKKGSEGTYHAIFLSLLEAMNIKTRAEEQTNIGRIDLIVEMKKAIFIFEFKIDKNAKKALQQIDLKKYKEKYLGNCKEIIAIGVNFSSKSRNISDWKSRSFF